MLRILSALALVSLSLFLPACIVRDINDGLTTVNRNVSDVDASVGRTNQRLDVVERDLATTNNALTVTNASLATTNDQLARVQDSLLRVDTTNEHLATLQGRLDGIQSSLMGIDAHLAGLRTALGSLDSLIPFVDLGGSPAEAPPTNAATPSDASAQPEAPPAPATQSRRDGLSGAWIQQELGWLLLLNSDGSAQSSRVRGVLAREQENPKEPLQFPPGQGTWEREGMTLILRVTNASNAEPQASRWRIYTSSARSLIVGPEAGGQLQLFVRP